MKNIRGIQLHLLQLIVLMLVTITASAQLRADFSAPVTSGCPPMVVNFTDNSTGTPTSWKWDLGNGTISFLQNPIATYFTPGSYEVKLVVKNANGADSVAKTNFIVVKELPTATFDVSDTAGCYPLKVSFTDNSFAGSGTIESWQWDFGDGTLSNEQNPVHTYTNPGSFTVILNIKNSNGCSQVITRSGLIKVQNGLKANFSYTSADGCHSPAAINFTNKTTGTGTISYLWDFGNGEKSTEENPTNNYNDAGVYTIKLIAANSYGCTDTVVKSNAINIGFVKADFVQPEKVCTGSPFQFKNASSPSSFVKTTWYFGDGEVSEAVDAIHTYSKPGTYQVKLVMDYGSCGDSIVKTVTVIDGATPAFTATNTTGCKAPLSVTFTNTSTGATSYEWNFGDGTKSTLANPEHTYTKSGEYTVTLIVTNANGCASTLVKSKLVKIVPLKINAIKNLPFEGCIPAAVSPVAALNDSVSTISYLWNFGDGGTSTVAKPTYTYTKGGVYNIKLTVTTGAGCFDTLTIVNAVKVGTKPKVEFAAENRDVCAFAPVNFKDLSTGATADRWFWTFGDGGTSSDQNPVRMYNDTGYFSVSLIVWNNGCSDTLQKEKYIHVRPPIAKFDTAFNCTAPLTRSFINKSAGATAWEWNFGDGSNSSDKNPTHTYSTPGVYEVALKVSNGVCEHTQVKSVVVIKETPVLEANIPVSCTNTRIVFNVTNTDPKNITNYRWFFDGLSGSGITTTNNPVANAYTTPGSRNVAVIITDILKCRDTVYTATPINTFGLKANFESLVTGTCLGNTINFIDSTKTDGTHPVATWNWNFGEGGSKEYTAATGVSHNYSAIGNYDVKLVVTDTYGCKDSIIKPAYISISKPVANFTVSDTALCPLSTVTFTNKSKALEAKYLWSFGDGNTSTKSSPTYQYTKPGSYTVKLVVVDKNGCRDSMSVKIQSFEAKADFTLSDSFSTCPPLIVNITNKSSNFVEHFWDFGDGGNSQLMDPSHIYTDAGVYTVTLSVKNTGGCTDTLVKKVKILGPTGSFTYTPIEACKPTKVEYTLKSKDAVKYIWDFNDGTTIFNTSTTALHIYDIAGKYLPKVILEDAGGCKVALNGADTLKINEIETFIVSDETVLCDSGYVAFKDSTYSTDSLSTFLWNFGDGQTSDQRMPSHHFSDTGNYSITLTTTSKIGCTSTAVKSSFIKVASSPAVKIMGDTSACEPAQLTFSGALTRPDTSQVQWNWNFGNGETSDLQKPAALTFPKAGSYIISAKATNSSGCSTSQNVTALIHPKPLIDAGNDTTICRAGDIVLKPRGADEYTWINHPSLSCVNCETPVAKPAVTTIYHVTGKSKFGCTAEDSVTVRVKQPFSMTVAKGDTVCAGESIVLNAAGADFYKWVPTLWLDNPNSATPKSNPDTTITYNVTGQDSIGCFKQTANITVKVYAKPTIEITNGESMKVQIGSSEKISTKSSPDVTSWKWVPQQWLSCATCAEPVTSPRDNITYSVVATNAGNCQSQDKVTVNVVCNNANVFIPNTFSPNGDGTNDVFYPRGAGLYNIKSFRIFNRWGQVVFMKDGVSPNNPSDGWDGTSNGVKLPADVYVYMVEVVCTNNIIFPFKGNITLVR